MMKLDMRREVLKALKRESVYAAQQAEQYDRVAKDPWPNGASVWKSKATKYRNRVKALRDLRRDFVALCDRNKM